jgi:hypothetical protein
MTFMEKVEGNADQSERKSLLYIAGMGRMCLLCARCSLVRAEAMVASEDMSVTSISALAVVQWLTLATVASTSHTIVATLRTQRLD